MNASLSLFSFQLQKESAVPLYQQLAEQILALAEGGALLPNEKLPPIRALAAHLGVNASTVVAAYRALEQKKAVYSRVGSGTFVSPIPREELPKERQEMPEVLLRRPVMEAGAINFTDTSLPPSLFPTSAFQQAINQLLEEEKGAAFGKMDSQGYLPLRDVLCRFLADYGILAHPENIQILYGAQQGLDVVSKALLNFGDVIFVEKPTFPGAVGAFYSRGCRVVELEMEEDGVHLGELENLAKLYRPRFFYTMAYFQTPTGISYSQSKKKKLLDLAEKYDFYIIEDDNLYDFNYTSHPLVPFKAMDHRSRVIYLKSFSKILMPGLRMGFAVFPRKLLSHMMRAKYTTDIATSGFLQKALARYLEENSWAAHIKTICAYGKDQYRLAVKYVDRYLSSAVTYQKPQGGISLWLRPKGFSAEVWLMEAAQKQVYLSPGSQFALSKGEENALRLCFIHVPQAKMEQGIRRLSQALKESGLTP